MSGEAFVVIATHGRFDEEALEQAVRTNASYIALVSSGKRAGSCCSSSASEACRDALARVKSPAGLDIGAQDRKRSRSASSPRSSRSGAPQIEKGAGHDRRTGGSDRPICHMTVSVADARHTADHNGRRYYFCCAHCQRTFEKSPTATPTGMRERNALQRNREDQRPAREGLAIPHRS